MRRGSRLRISPVRASIGHPGQQVQGNLHDLQPDLVLCRLVQGQAAQAVGAGAAGHRR